MFLTYAFEISKAEVIKPRSACSDISGSLLWEKLVSGFYCLLNIKKEKKKKEASF